jgi:hypothetical protein
MTDQLIPLTEPERLIAAGLPFRTVDRARWAYRRRKEHGTARAFHRLGRRIFVNPRAYLAALADRDAPA